MAEQSQGTDQNYKKLRSEFDHLQLEEKAVFLIESGLSLVIHGLDSLVTFIRDEVNKVMENEEETSHNEAAEESEATSSTDVGSEDESNKDDSSEEDNKDDDGGKKAT